MQSHWFQDYWWLRYSKSKDAIFCAPCYLFGSKSGDSKQKAFSANPISDWSNTGKLLKTHDNHPGHKSSCEASENFLDVLSGEKKGILCSLSSSYNDLVKKNREILKSITDVIILCGKQNLALHGHEEKDSNFVALLNFQAKHNTLLKEHIEKADPRTKYTSPDIQNELIGICGDVILKDIVHSCNQAPCFAVIADEATDASTMEQMALCVRFFDEGKGEVREDFLGFNECSSTTGEALAEAIASNLQDKGLFINRLRGQGYDGAANMSGGYRGVQSRIRQIVPRAVYTHCKAHSLNLAIVHASQEPLVRNMFNTVQEIAFAFNYSAKRLLRFQTNLENDLVTREEMDRRTKLQSLCETRWASRADALHTFKSSFPVVCSALHDLADDGDCKARGYQNSIEKFDFIVSLVAVEHVLSSLVPLSQLLQKKTCELLTAVSEARVMSSLLTAERNDPAVWEALYVRSVEIAEAVDVQPTFPRVNQRQRNRPNVPAITASEYWRLNMYLPFIDHLIAELQTRLLDGEDRYFAQYLLPRKTVDLTDARTRDIYTAYQADIQSDEETFVREIQRWTVKWAQADNAPDTLVDTLKVINGDIYPSIKICVTVLVCMPVSTAMAERSFSTMKRVKSYLRSTMTTARLSGLGLLHIYKEKELDAEHIVDVFARRKERRMGLLFRVLFIFY